MLSRLKGMSRGGWMTVGIVLGVILVPGVAIAAFSDVRIVGSSGSTTANVTAAQQLLTAPTTPANIVRFADVVEPTKRCASFAAPTGRSFMLTQALIDVFQNPSPDLNDSIVVLSGKNCTSGSIVASVTPSSTGPLVIPFEPGVPVPSNGGFSVYSYADLAATVHLTGYRMPSGAVPAQSAVISKRRLSRRATRR